MAISSGYRANFTTLLRAADNGDLAIMECVRKSDGVTVVLVCAVSRLQGEALFSPLAEMVSGNPFEMYDPPDVLKDATRPETIEVSGTVVTKPMLPALPAPSLPQKKKCRHMWYSTELPRGRMCRTCGLTQQYSVEKRKWVQV